VSSCISKVLCYYSSTSYADEAGLDLPAEHRITLRHRRNAMYDFHLIPAGPKSIGHRKPVFGIGINDADYVVCPTVNGKQQWCRFYTVWHSMIRRCYSPIAQRRNPTYIGCTVCDEWLRFSAFKKWMEKQAWRGNQLDKDIIIPGNKIYSPDTCCFVSGATNTLLLDSAGSRGKYPLGVSLLQSTGRFMAYCSHNKKLEHIGYFATPEEASAAYRKRKAEVLYEAAMAQGDKRVRRGLLARCKLLATNKM